jgi:hypothetical protein
MDYSDILKDPDIGNKKISLSQFQKNSLNYILNSILICLILLYSSQNIWTKVPVLQINPKLFEMFLIIYWISDSNQKRSFGPILVAYSQDKKIILTQLLTYM